MAHDRVYGICEQKCRVEVPSKETFDDTVTQISEDINAALKEKANSNHNHDDRYSLLNHNHSNNYYLKSETYTKSQTNDAIATGLNQQLKTKSYNASGGQGAANEVKYITVDVTLAGYTPLIGVVTSSLCIEAQVSISGNTATVTVRNGSDAGSLSATFTVLYSKNNAIG